MTSKQVTSPPWNSRRLVHSKEMVRASRWSVALRTFYRQVLSLPYSSFFFWNFRPRLARELLVVIPKFILGKTSMKGPDLEWKVHGICHKLVCFQVDIPATLSISICSTQQKNISSNAHDILDVSCPQGIHRRTCLGAAHSHSTSMGAFMRSTSSRCRWGVSSRSGATNSLSSCNPNRLTFCTFSDPTALAGATCHVFLHSLTQGLFFGRL